MWILGLKGLKNKLKEFDKRSNDFPSGGYLFLSIFTTVFS